MYKTNENDYVYLKELYKDSEKTYTQDLVSGKYAGLDKLEIEKSYYNLTELGYAFIEACTN